MQANDFKFIGELMRKKLRTLNEQKENKRKKKNLTMLSANKYLQINTIKSFSILKFGLSAIIKRSAQSLKKK